MTKITRFLIDVDTNWQVTISCPTIGAAWSLPPRLLRSQTAPGNRKFPKPPHNDLPQTNKAWYPLCEGEVEPLWNTYQNIAKRDPNPKPPGDIELFGQYLFQTLIGSNWQTMLDAAQSHGTDVIELALSWDKNDGDLHRLNWEMMNSGEGGFLAARTQMPVAISRIIANSVHQVRDISLPPRLLFAP